MKKSNTPTKSIKTIINIEEKIINLLKEDNFSIDESILLFGHLIHCAAQSNNLSTQDTFDYLKAKFKNLAKKKIHPIPS